jgi:metal transporter CNNM
MTPLEKTYMLSIDLVINKELLREVYVKGYSRIPIYQNKRENVIGILMSRDLILINPDKYQITIR